MGIPYKNKKAKKVIIDNLPKRGVSYRQENVGSKSK